MALTYYTMTSDSQDILKLLYATDPKKQVEQFCQNPFGFNHAFLLDMAHDLGLKASATTPKAELCLMIREAQGYINIFSRMKTGFVHTFQALSAFFSSNQYLKHMMNTIVSDMSDPICQYVFITGSPTVKEVKGIASHFADREAYAYIILQQYATQYSLMISTLNMMVYGVPWSLGRMFSGSNPPYIRVSATNHKAMVLALVHKLNIVMSNITFLYEKLHDDPQTHAYLKVMEDRRQNQEKLAVQRANTTAIVGAIQGIGAKLDTSSRHPRHPST